MKKEDPEFQLKLKAYLNEFYAEIYGVRLRIEIHKEIGNASANNPHLKNNQYLGFVQQHENVSAVVLRMFSIFDENNSHLFKKFSGFLRTQNIYILQESDLDKWLAVLEPYKNFRHREIAHASLDNSFAPPVMYVNFLTIISEFEAKLLKIHEKFIIHHSVKNGSWNVSQVDPSTVAVLVDLRSLLQAPKKSLLTRIVNQLKACMPRGAKKKHTPWSST